jgi:hypothetical protein
VWSYIRPKGAGDSSQPSQAFRSTYPGAYTTLVSTSSPRLQWTDAEGTLPASWPLPTKINWQTYPPLSNGTGGATPVFGQGSGGMPGAPGTNFPPIQIFNLAGDSSGQNGIHFPNAAYRQNLVAQSQQYPFGAFARIGDMLEIPYVGSYRIRTISQVSASSSAPANFLELNPLPMDCAMAAIDTSGLIEPFENIGRFIPLSNNPAFPKNQTDYFSWTRGVLDYFTVQSMSDDYLPNVDPGIFDVTVPPHAYPGEAQNPGYIYPPAAMPAQTGMAIPPNVTQTLNRDPTAGTELGQDDVGAEGLVNINTASYQVLAQLPLVSPAGSFDAKTSAAQNLAMAKAIVDWRNVHGPFMSLFDLNSVTLASDPAKGFQNEGGNLQNFSQVTSQFGILTPPDPAFPGISSPATSNQVAQEDFQADTIALSHISNLMTTRSDTFTVYIVLQGWAHAGTPQAIPVVTRRLAFIADRSKIRPDLRSRDVRSVVVPGG